MNSTLSQNSQAILLLTAPLVAGRKEEAVELLSFSEYNRAARLLREKQLQPADLIVSDNSGAISVIESKFGRVQDRIVARQRISFKPGNRAMVRSRDLDSQPR